MMPAETYSGPSDLTDALNAAEPSPIWAGLRIAISVPNGDLIACCHEDMNGIMIRRVNKVSGRAGSVMDTGEWITDPEALKSAEKLSWRPA